MSDDKIRVVVAMDFSDEILARLREISPRLQIDRYFPQVPESAYADAEVLYSLRDFPTPEQAPDLRWIQTHNAGMDKLVNLPIVNADNVEVTTVSGIHATSIAEYCLAMMLNFAFKLPSFRGLQAQAKWPEKALPIQPLRGQTLGIAGYGAIGRELARLADALGMTVLATKRDLRQMAVTARYTEDGLGDSTADIPERLYPSQALASMVRACDYVVLAVPLTDETRHMVDASIFDAMKPSAVLVNVARGAVIDTDALVEALREKKIRGAALDVFEPEPLPAESPLWKLDNVLISPHISGNTPLYHQKAAAVFEENLRRYVENEPLLNRYERDKGY